MDAAGLLRPLEQERGAIEALGTYRSQTELIEAVGRVRSAVDRVLRLALRAEAGAPDDVRLRALSPGQLPLEEVVAALRRRDRITLDLAGLIHALEQAADRAAAGDVRAADADDARHAVRRLALELAGPPAEVGAEPSPLEPEGEPLPRVGSAERRRGRRRVWALGAVLAMASLVAVALWTRESAVDRGIAAFEGGRMAEAERRLAGIAEGDRSATVWLYLGRIYRRGGRYEDAASALRAAVAAWPDDAGVRRELGYLFLDLGRPEPAVEQFRRALELGPEESLNWIGLIRALRDAGSPEAESWLSRAPAEVRAAFSR